MQPKRYRKKPVTVSAVQYPNMPIDAPGMLEAQAQIIDWCGGRRAGGAYELIAIDTLEGTMFAQPGDWVVEGTRGEFYPVKPGPFADTFELAT